MGTPTHIAPEKWKDYTIKTDVKFDVYSFGILLWELFADEKPFSDCRPGVLLVSFYKGTRITSSRLCDSGTRLLTLRLKILAEK